MDLFTRDDLRTLLALHNRPCVSLFMPTPPGGAEQDSIRFRNLLKEAEGRLATLGSRPAEAKDLLAPFRSLLDEGSFWRNQSDGLAAFLATDFQRIYRLPLAFAEEVEVGGLFHVAPLLPLLAGDGRFFVLALSQNSVRLFQGTRSTMSPVDLKGVPRSLAEALLTHDRDEVLTFHTRRTPGGSWGAIFEGHGVGIDDAKDNLKLYFQRIDAALHPFFREERVPLVLAAVDYLHSIYREANSYPHLLAKGIVGSPDRLSEKELHDRAWAIVAPHFQESVQKARARFAQAAPAGKTTADAAEIIPAAHRGEFETLFIEAGEHRWGVFDPERNEVALHERQQPGDEDLCNLAAIQTLRHGHAVHVLSIEDMPARASLAAIYHLPLPHHAGKR